MSVERTVATLLAEYPRRAAPPGTVVAADAGSLGCDGVVVESAAGLEKALAPAFSGRLARWSSRPGSTPRNTPRSSRGH